MMYPVDERKAGLLMGRHARFHGLRTNSTHIGCVRHASVWYIGVRRYVPPPSATDVCAQFPSKAMRLPRSVTRLMRAAPVF